MVFPACFSANKRRSVADDIVDAVVSSLLLVVCCLYRKLDLPRRFLVEESEEEGAVVLVLVSVVDGNKVVVVASENNAVEKHVGADRCPRTSDRTDDNPRTPGCTAMKRSIRPRDFIVCFLSTTIDGNRYSSYGIRLCLLKQATVDCRVDRSCF